MTRMSMSWNARPAKAAALRGATQGLELAAEHVLQEATRIVPIEERTLQDSGTASVDGLRAAVSYDTPYAVVQHEDLTLNHDPGKTAKYLEKPMMEERPVVARLIQRAIAKALGWRAW